MLSHALPDQWDPVSSRNSDLLPKVLTEASPSAGEITVNTDCPVASVILIFHLLFAASGIGDAHFR